MFGEYGSPEGLAEASGVDAYGGFGDSAGGGSSFTQAMKNAWNSYWGGFKNNPGQWREGPITGPYSSPFQSGWGNIDAMTNAYGPGSPVDPMSGGMGNRPGAGWSPGIIFIVGTASTCVVDKPLPTALLAAIKSFIAALSPPNCLVNPPPTTCALRPEPTS